MYEALPTKQRHNLGWLCDKDLDFRIFLSRLFFSGFALLIWIPIIRNIHLFKLDGEITVSFEKILSLILKVKWCIRNKTRQLREEHVKLVREAN